MEIANYSFVHFIIIIIIIYFEYHDKDNRYSLYVANSQKKRRLVALHS